MRRLLILLFLAFCFSHGSLALAGSTLSYEQIREAREKGEIRSLRWVTHQIQAVYPGRLLDAALSQKNGRYIYRIKLLQPGGYVSKLVVDAYTAEVLRSRSRPIDKKRKH